MCYHFYRAVPHQSSLQVVYKVIGKCKKEKKSMKELLPWTRRRAHNENRRKVEVCMMFDFMRVCECPSEKISCPILPWILMFPIKSSWILMFPIKKQNIPSFTKRVGFNSIICKYLYIFLKNTWAELHFFLITYMPQYIISAPTSCTCKAEFPDEKSVQDDNKLAECCKRSNLSAMQFRPERMW